MPTAKFMNFDVDVTSDKALPDKSPLELANRIDVTLTIRDSAGGILVKADRFGYTGAKGSFAANATPFTNLQRFLLQHGS